MNESINFALLLVTIISTIVAFVSTIAAIINTQASVRSTKTAERALEESQKNNSENQVLQEKMLALAIEHHKLEAEHRQLEAEHRKKDQDYVRVNTRIDSMLRDIAFHDLSLTAYSRAVDRLVELKASFAEREDIFREQMKRANQLDKIPPSMQDDIPQFLLFAGALWKFSYVYSVTQRWEVCGLREEEKIGLEKEIKLWLALPGFREVYKYHTQELKAHNPKYLEFLEELYADKTEAE